MQHDWYCPHCLRSGYYSSAASYESKPDCHKCGKPMKRETKMVTKIVDAKMKAHKLDV